MEGNQQKMREALEKLVAHLENEIALTKKCNRCEYKGKSFRGEPCNWHVDCGIEDYERKASDAAKFLLNKFKLRTALSAPPRNCDVGTAEEQSVRFRAMCNKYYCDEYECDKNCPLASLDIIHGFPRCQSYWAQMPYDAEEGGAK